MCENVERGLPSRQRVSHNVLFWNFLGIRFFVECVSLLQCKCSFRMVEEILDTRLMVKRCMSRYKSDKGLHKLLHARQLGLKLIANVTFGYAAANFSGRMPCVEVGVMLITDNTF